MTKLPALIENRVKPSRRVRRGIALLAALACITIVAALATSMLKATLRTHASLATDRQCRQAMLLAEAALIRAAGAIDADTNYVGETWRLDPTQLHGSAAAEIVIDVTGPESARRIRVTAAYPAEDPLGVRRTLTATYRSPRPQ